MAWTSPSLASVARYRERDTPCYCPPATITLPDWVKVPDTLPLLPGCKAGLKRLSRRRGTPQRGWTRGMSIPLRAIEPGDVATPWFNELSPWLKSTRVELECAVGAWRQKCTVSALTALTLLQRREGPCDDGAAVFFRADAGNVAGDIRRGGLGRIWGECTAQLVVHDTLWDVVAGGEMGLLYACADVLVAYIAQLDEAQIGEVNVSHRVEAALDLLVYNYEWPGEDRYVLDGVRTGIVYGAVVGYLSDVWGGPSPSGLGTDNSGEAAAGLVSVGEMTVEHTDPQFMDDGEWREELDEVIFWFNEELRAVEVGWGHDAGATPDDMVRFRSTAAATFVRLAQREGVTLSNRIAPETPLVHPLPDANVYRYGSDTTTAPLLRLPEFIALLLAATRRAQ